LASQLDPFDPRDYRLFLSLSCLPTKRLLAFAASPDASALRVCRLRLDSFFRLLLTASSIPLNLPKLASLRRGALLSLWAAEIVIMSSAFETDSPHPPSDAASSDSRFFRFCFRCLASHPTVRQCRCPKLSDSSAGCNNLLLACSFATFFSFVMFTQGFATPQKGVAHAHASRHNDFLDGQRQIEYWIPMQLDPLEDGLLGAYLTNLHR
jgi:hypothetical protein